MSKNYMVTTSDNPYNYFTQFDEWYAWDTPRYGTLSLLARVTRTSDELPLALQEAAIDDAIEEIVTENVSGVHIKVAEPEKDSIPS
ncbi:hypothetical protein SEA_CRICKO_94 [Streptomyces phage CricKo]|jgi:hypothetical protein|nr:hypothetical protein SEA_RAINYDAI_91 [Streptomyces phage Rainydai]AWN06189.1 hypothetical protein SEA_SENDITCS_86 [Streptomyces phage SendItCS]QJD49977.1 hypothetical protein SEA_CRICKO_94 [Streptomyces phage CricKo]QNL30709.1 hypothetical protein SEA_THIQQUMS_94 [Streptomyces phage Thiqqums]WIC89425.1 hypothetical protein SEA_MIEK_88 [Streptomyces phage Miek]